MMIEKLLDPRFLGVMLTGIAVPATAFAVVQPLMEPDRLAQRMKLVSDEREAMRRRERDRLAKKVTLRVEPKAYMKRIVEQFDLNRWLGTEAAKRQLMMAGYRGAGAETGFLFFRLIMPVVLTLGAAFYLLVLQVLDQSVPVPLGP